MSTKTSKKHLAILGALIGVLLLTVVIVLIGSLPKDYVIKVNGSPVFEEEFNMVLKQYTLQYEQQLCVEKAVPEGQTLLEFLGNDKKEYEELLFQQNIRQMSMFRIKQWLAQENGLIGEFTYKNFLKSLEDENKIRSDKISKGEVVYGLTVFSPEQYYTYYMSNLNEKLKQELGKEKLVVTDEEVYTYYSDLTVPANLYGEKLYYTFYDITQAVNLTDKEYESLCNKIRDMLKVSKDDTITVGGYVFKAKKRIFSPRELRDFSRQNYMDSENLLRLEKYEISEPFSQGGSTYIVQYNGFDKAGTLDDNSKDVIIEILREKAYSTLIEEEINRADIKINKALFNNP